MDSKGSVKKSVSEKVVCRICHFGKEMELFKLGCDCKGALASSHKHCAKAWFTHKGDRLCEICGKTAKNIRDSGEETSIFMMEWDEMRVVAASLEDPQDSRSCRCHQCLCSLVLACFVLLFMLLWFFRVLSH